MLPLNGGQDFAQRQWRVDRRSLRESAFRKQDDAGEAEDETSAMAMRAKPGKTMLGHSSVMVWAVVAPERPAGRRQPRGSASAECLATAVVRCESVRSRPLRPPARSAEWRRSRALRSWTRSGDRRLRSRRFGQFASDRGGHEDRCRRNRREQAIRGDLLSLRDRAEMEGSVPGVLIPCINSRHVLVSVSA